MNEQKAQKEESAYHIDEQAATTRFIGCVLGYLGQGFLTRIAV